MKYCGPEVEVEGIVRSRPAAAPRTATSAASPASSPRRCARCGSTSPSWSRAAKQTAATGATRVLHRRRRPRARRAADGADARGRRGDPRRAVDINVAALARHAHPGAGRRPASTMGVHRYNHNLEAARSYFPQRRHHPLLRGALGHLPDGHASRAWSCAAAAWSAWARRSSSAPSSPPSSASSSPHEVPLNFLNPRPGTPFGDLPLMDGQRRAAHDRGVPAGAAAHDPAVRRRARAHPRRPRHPRRPARRHQRGHRRQLPHHPRPRPRARTSRCSTTSKMPIKALNETL